MSNRFCTKCGREVAEGKRFCGGCGQAMPVVAGLAQPEPAAVSGPATAPCAQCGAALTPGKRFCKQCGHAVGEPAPVAPVEAVPSGRDGSRAGEAAAPDLPPTVAVVAQADMPVAAKDESSYISGGPAIAAEPDITHHARDGQETAKTYPQEPVEEDSQTSPTTVPNSTFILPPPVPTGHSKLKAGIAIGAAAIVLAAAGGGWAWYAHAHRSIAPVANAPSESLPSTTAAAPSTAASSTQIAPTGKIDAASIEGQYAYDVIEMPPIRSKLASLLDKESLKDFKARLQVAGPVEHQGEWLVGEGLAPHSGGSDEAAFAINTNSGAIFGVMMTNGDHFRSFGVDAPAKLPSPLLAWYRERGGSLRRASTATVNSETGVQKAGASQVKQQGVSGVLRYQGPPVPYNGTVVFDNLPKARLKFSFDHAAWQLVLNHNPDGTKKAILTSQKPGYQSRCDLGWEIVE